MSEELKYKFNPYTFARISAMKSLLLKKEDYDKIMKLSSNELIKYLQEGVYGKEINSLSIKYSGVKLIENTLNKHLERIFLKLRLISDPSIEYLMIQYLKRYDFWNLKTLLRAKLTGASSEEVMDMMLPVGELKKEKLIQLYKLSNAREILDACGLINKSEFENPLNDYETSHNLGIIENLLDFHYYKDSIEFAQKIPTQGKLFKEFFKYEFDIYNLKLLLKKIVFGLSKKDVENYLLDEGRDISKNILYELLNAEKLSSFMRILSKTNYRKVLPEIAEDQDPLMQYEILLERFLLKKSILLYHQNPLTVDVVLGFMFAKEIEVRNLRVIMKSKNLEFTEDYVKNLIIIE